MTYERVVATKREGKLALLGMVSDDLSNGLTNPGHEPRILELPDRRVILGIDRFELVVAIEIDVPAKLFQLIYYSCVHEVNWTVIYAETMLCDAISSDLTFVSICK